MLLDTNIVIHASQPGGAWLSPWSENPAAALASVVCIEALGFAQLKQEEEAAIRRLLAATLCYHLDDEIIERAVSLRQQKRMKLGDAIIAATALEYDLPLVTRNEADFSHIHTLTIINPFAPQPQSRI